MPATNEEALKQLLRASTAAAQIHSTGHAAVLLLLLPLLLELLQPPPSELLSNHKGGRRLAKDSRIRAVTGHAPAAGAPLKRSCYLNARSHSWAWLALGEAQ